METFINNIIIIIIIIITIRLSHLAIHVLFQMSCTLLVYVLAVLWNSAILNGEPALSPDLGS